jgi:hypothetical protein
MHRCLLFALALTVTGCAASGADSRYPQGLMEIRSYPALSPDRLARCVHDRLAPQHRHGLALVAVADGVDLVRSTAGGATLWTLAFRPGQPGTTVSLSGYQTYAGTDRTAPGRLFPEVEACSAGRRD